MPLFAHTAIFASHKTVLSVFLLGFTAPVSVSQLSYPIAWNIVANPEMLRRIDPALRNPSIDTFRVLEDLVVDYFLDNVPVETHLHKDDIKLLDKELQRFYRLIADIFQLKLDSSDRTLLRRARRIFDSIAVDREKWWTNITVDFPEVAAKLSRSVVHAVGSSADVLLDWQKKHCRFDYVIDPKDIQNLDNSQTTILDVAPRCFFSEEAARSVSVPRVNRADAAANMSADLGEDVLRSAASLLDQAKRKRWSDVQLQESLFELLGPEMCIKYGEAIMSGGLPTHLRPDASLARNLSQLKVSLPAHAEQIDHGPYEEIRIPIDSNRQKPPTVERIPIALLDEIGQKVFSHVDSLNPIQSTVFDTAYNTNENMLVCAPTGAGKTNIALLALTRALRNSGVGHFGASFKAVYVAPMKALAAEMCESFKARLGPLNIKVREWTGDMQLTRREVEETHVFVTTPEKWDVVTRKADAGSAEDIRLMILDEIHLLHEDRGPVIEAIVARTLRESERQQRVIRLVALSATLPNYLDVAQFLRVHPSRGLFFFGPEFRPCPLATSFFGVRDGGASQRSAQVMMQIAFDRCIDAVRNGKQVLVFVHSRKETVRTALGLRDLARRDSKTALFSPKTTGISLAQTYKLKADDAAALLQDGFCVHHAGLLRSDRNSIEKAFSNGHVRVLVSTATLAWGVNLPAHAVVIKGTEIYDAQRGGFVQLSMLDVLQMFGRAGRPQFDAFGVASLITSHKELPHYVSMFGTNSTTIESQLHEQMADYLNAEIVRGTVSNIREACAWVSYTFLAVRIHANPFRYGQGSVREIVVAAARLLDAAKMVRYDAETSTLHPTDYGRVGALYYLSHQTMAMFHEAIEKSTELSEADIIKMVAQAHEFQQISSQKREEEDAELCELRESCCKIVKTELKVGVLLQALFARVSVRSFSLTSDMGYIAQNAARIFRGLFDMAIRRRKSGLAFAFLEYSICVDRQMWPWDHPLRQLLQGSDREFVPNIVIEKLNDHDLDIGRLREMSASDIGSLLNERRNADFILRCARSFPVVEVSDVRVQPVTRNILRVQVIVSPLWGGDSQRRSRKRNNGKDAESAEPFWMWVEDPFHDIGTMLHVQSFLVSSPDEDVELHFTIPAREPLPAQYTIRVMSERWLGSEAVGTIRLNDIVLPQLVSPMTDLLPLVPLHISALQNARFEDLYARKRPSLRYLNPVQSQCFHALYHTDKNILMGAPTGSGKTLIAELSVLRVLAAQAGGKCIYIAPLKALVKERLSDWRQLFGERVAKVEELSGDVTPDSGVLQEADIIVTTPEKWDGISRNWMHRPYVQSVALIIFDEIHMLGGDRGAILEVIVSRMRYMAWCLKKTVRFVGLSTALANAGDLGSWLDVDPYSGLFNFRPTVRPVPCTVHIYSVPGRNYCPRMAAMNKPVYSSIREYSEGKPVLIFVSSRRQTRLTAQALIAHAAYDEQPRMFVKDDYADEIEALCEASVQDPVLRDLLLFGVGLHHAGLSESDRLIVERLFGQAKIMLLVSTSTLAWGVNLPAHMVVVKGTEFFDAPSRGYVDMPITDVLQMIGRAGRPQFDDYAVAAVFCETSKKDFYQRFLYQPFPVESSLLCGMSDFEKARSEQKTSLTVRRKVFADHLNAEIASGVLTSRKACMDYLTWTYLWRRLPQNPSFYGVPFSSDNQPAVVESFAQHIVEEAINFLVECGCIQQTSTSTRPRVRDGFDHVYSQGLDDNMSPSLEGTPLGKIAATYYTYPRTANAFSLALTDVQCITISDAVGMLAGADEYNEVPVRHNEDEVNRQWSTELALPNRDAIADWQSPNVKAHLLLLAHMKRSTLPISDYVADTKGVLDQALRLLQAALDIAVMLGNANKAILVVHLTQMLMQGIFSERDAFLQIAVPHASQSKATSFRDYVYKNGARVSELAHFPRLDVAIHFDVKSNVVRVSIDRLSRSQEYAKLGKLQRQKKESFIVLVTRAINGGDAIVGFQRTDLRSRQSVLEFASKTDDVDIIWGSPHFTVRVMSDSYFGLDCVCSSTQLP